jgi:ferredoxin--NADP+ reductase/benzoate/toluate 1,2-dioxygenase reductase subunit
MKTVTTKNNIVPVLGTRHLTDSTYVVRMDRNGFHFEAGQYISLGLPGSAEKREYSIYSGINDDYLEVLVREIDGGIVSRQLKNLRPGARAEMDGPFGFFTLGLEQQSGRRLVFVASGTGIAPFHSFIKSHPSIKYTLIHGVRFRDEAYDAAAFEKDRYVLCTSRDDRGDHHGRVSDYLAGIQEDPDADYYLCGNSNMIHDVYDILKGKGVETGRIHAEVYF